MLQDNKNRLIYLSSLTLLLSTLEYLIPKPIPFFKLGLANLPLLFTLPILPFNQYFILAILKSLSQAIIGGTLFSPFFLISLAGTISTAFVMKFAYKYIKGLSFVGISLLGALASNSSQILISSIIIYGKSIFVAFPLILGLGIITSSILGYIANIFYKKSKFIVFCKTNELPSVKEFVNLDDSNKTSEKFINTIFFCFAILSIILSIFINKIYLLIILLFSCYIIQKLSKRKIKITYPLILFSSMILLSTIEPNGKVILKYFTETALILATTKALRILIIISSSQILVGCNKINFGPFKDIFALSSILLERFTKTEGTLIERVDKALLFNK